MARQARTVIPGQAMHVMVRGNNRETLFLPMKIGALI